MRVPARHAALCCAAILQAPWTARAEGDSAEAGRGIQIPAGRGKAVAWEKFGPVRIVLKDGSVKKDCLLREIHAYWIVYQKNGSLHDQMIEKIQRIEISTEDVPVLIFDEKNRPVILGVEKNGEDAETEKP